MHWLEQKKSSLLCLLISFLFCCPSCVNLCVDSAKDESDCSDGYVTDGFATMDVFEYEVDDSSDSEDLYSLGSSSGTDVCFQHGIRCAFYAVLLFM